MKRFVSRLLAFLVLMFIVDRGFGLTMEYLQTHAKGGYIGHHNYILHQAKEDILIFGSSRAIHHYNPQILSDSLGMSCYNCGQDGNGIILFYAWWQMMKGRHCPKVIIYDVTPGFDLIAGDDNHRYLGWLRSEYENESVKEIFEEIDPIEKYKMQSMMYRYNSKFLQNITDYFHPVFQISSNGYLPLEGEMDKMRTKDISSDGGSSFVFDLQKLYYLKEFVKDVKEQGIILVFVSSPNWYVIDETHFSPLVEICKIQNIPFFNFSKDTNYVKRDEMFIDGVHLNSCGADAFTKKLCTMVKPLLGKRDGY